MKTETKNTENFQHISPKLNKNIYLFFRSDGFYPIELKDDEDAIVNAEFNKGTLQVQDMSGRIVWSYNC